MVIWFTGLPGSGKTTLAKELAIKLEKLSRPCLLLDGDQVRSGVNHDLGFSESDRFENIRRVAEMAKLTLDSNITVIAAFVSPSESIRQIARDIIGREKMFGIYLNPSIAVCEDRDPKDMYKKARRGEIPNFTGVGSAFEPVVNPNLTIDTGNHSVEESVQIIISALSLT